MPKVSAAGAIRDLPLLARLANEDIEALASRGRVRTYQPGAVIFLQGEPGDSMHVVMEGQVRITVNSENGGEAVLAVIAAGDCFGELALFDGRPRSAVASASGPTPTRTFIVTRDTFVTWLRDRPDAALALLETLSLRLRRTNDSLADLSFLDVPHRIAKALVSMVAPQHRNGPARITITQAEMGARLGISRESVNKQLNAFEREGWVELRRGAVVVRNVNALRAFA